jgi:hypothetical protein
MLATVIAAKQKQIAKFSLMTQVTLNKREATETISSPAKKLTTESLVDVLKVKKLSEDAQLPKRGSSKAAGYDLFRCFPLA